MEGALGVGGGADCTFSNKRHTVDVFPLLSVSDLSEIVLLSFVEEFVAFFFIHYCDLLCQTVQALSSFSLKRCLTCASCVCIEITLLALPKWNSVYFLMGLVFILKPKTRYSWE